MSAASDLCDLHKEMLVKYLKFFYSKKEGCTKEVSWIFEEDKKEQYLVQ